MNMKICVIVRLRDVKNSGEKNQKKMEFSRNIRYRENRRNPCPSREAFKVIASFKPLDFSFLKVSNGRIFAGDAATELKEVLAVLKEAPAFSELILSYLVGNGCE